MQLAERISRISVSPTLAVVVEAERYKAEGIDVVDFGAGEPDFPTPMNIKHAGVRAIEQNFTKYTSAAGIAELRQAIVEWHAREFGSRYKPSEVIVCVGGKHAIFNAASALLNSGDDVLLPVPYWVSFLDIVNYVGGRPVLVPTDESAGFRLSADVVERAWTSRTKMLIVNSPSNPSGAVVRKEEFARLLELCQARNAVLLSDECYSHFLYDGLERFSVAMLPGAKEHAVLIGSVSKTFSMTGWRIGYALAPEPVINAMLRLQSHSTSNPASMAQKAAVEALRGPQSSIGQMLEEYARRRERIVSGLENIPGIRCARPQGAFYVYPNIGAYLGGEGLRDTTALARKLLAEAHVAVVPGEAFGTREHIRISYAASMDAIEEGLSRMERFFARLR